jgi:hypothetical protein
MSKKRSKEIVTQKSKPDTSDIIDQTIINLAEGITGIASSERAEWLRSVGYLLQRMRSGRFLETFRNEWNAYREKGQVKDDYLFTDQHQECLQELLDFLDQDTPDQVRFTILKNIFLTTASETISNRHSAIPQQYMKICRSLTSGEVLVLLAVSQLAKDGATLSPPTSANAWLNTVTHKSELIDSELVELHERGLIEKKLLTPRVHPDASGINLGSNFRLTGLAVNLCKFIESHPTGENA